MVGNASALCNVVKSIYIIIYIYIYIKYIIYYIIISSCSCMKGGRSGECLHQVLQACFDRQGVPCFLGKMLSSRGKDMSILQWC